MDSQPTPVASLLAAGGVAANGPIRAMLAEVAARCRVPLYLPEPVLCADNATMIAATGCLLGRAGLTHDLSLAPIPRGRKVPWDYQTAPPAGAGSVDSRSVPQ